MFFLCIQSFIQEQKKRNFCDRGIKRTVNTRNTYKNKLFCPVERYHGSNRRSGSLVTHWCRTLKEIALKVVRGDIPQQSVSKSNDYRWETLYPLLSDRKAENEAESGVCSISLGSKMESRLNKMIVR